MGARQTGKTYILKEFGSKEYENLIYCNFEEEPALQEFFKASLNPAKILESLLFHKKQTFRPGKDVLFLDEIQASNNALNSLKYFNENAPDLHVMAAGSLLGVKMSKPRSFPVGKVTILGLYPMTFAEFLDAVGETRYRELLENLKTPEPLLSPFHDELCGLLKKYYLIGGMPEAVSAYTASQSYEKVRKVQADILNTYVLDFAKHAPASDVPKLSLIWDSIPLHLARENKKFIFSALARSARAREYENALQWLQDAGLIRKAYAVENVQQPLAGFTDWSAFKVYALDVGLLGAMARIAPEILLNGNELFTTYRGAFTENYAAQQLTGLHPEALYYWKSEGQKAEVDFLIRHDTGIYPLEVKAGINTKSKSLQSYRKRFKPALLLRSTLQNLKKDADILNVPLYALNYLASFLSLPARSDLIS